MKLPVSSKSFPAPARGGGYLLGLFFWGGALRSPHYERRQRGGRWHQNTGGGGRTRWVLGFPQWRCNINGLLEGEMRGGWDGKHQADGSLFLERMGKDIFFCPITLDPESATPMLLGPDLRDWVAEDDLIYFVIEAIESLVPAAFHVM